MRISKHARSLNSTDRGLQVCEEKAGLQKRNPVEVEVMKNCQPEVLVLLFSKLSTRSKGCNETLKAYPSRDDARFEESKKSRYEKESYP